MDSNLPRLQLELYKEIKKVMGNCILYATCLYTNKWNDKVIKFNMIVEVVTLVLVMMLNWICVSLQNGASRSLRAALWRFAELAHLIRPQKCRYTYRWKMIFYFIHMTVLSYFSALLASQSSMVRGVDITIIQYLHTNALFSTLCCRPYLVNLLPCLTRITKRQEESVQETLAAAMPKIMAALGHFANDSEIKVSIQGFLEFVSNVCFMFFCLDSRSLFACIFSA